MLLVMPPSARLLLLLLHFLLLFLLRPVAGFPKAFSFELPDRRRMCFYEDFHDVARYVFSYRVIRGGSNDVDVRILDPAKAELYNRQKSHKDTFNFKATAGRHSFCFSNEFSTISHKQVFFELRPERFETLGEEAGDSKQSVPTLSESTMDSIHVALSQVEEYQTEYRTREAAGRSLSEDLNERVLFWSCLIAVAILVIGLGQVTVLKAFFTDRHGPMGSAGAKYQVPT